MAHADDAINDSQRPAPEPDGASSEDHPEPVTVAQYATEIQATFAANMLREAGIRCELLGGSSSGFKAESPGYVRLMVSQNDETRARALLEDFQAEKAPDEADANDD
ncbi:MAG: putative signal transducing protein [Phycisphaerales bacterium JB060]